MGYAVTGYPSRSDKRRRQTQYRFRAYEDDRRGRKGKERPKKKGGTEDRVGCMRAPVTNLQDLPVDVLERIYVLSRDLTLMPALNSYFYHNLKLSSHLLGKFMWEIYTFDHRNLVLHEEACPIDEGKVVLFDTIFDSRIFFDYFRNNYSELSKRIGGYIPGYILEEDMSVPLAREEAIRLVMREAPYNFPSRFYNEFEHLFLHREMMSDLGTFFSFQLVSDLFEGLLHWLFTEFPPFVENYDQIHDTILFTLNLISEYRRFMPIDPLCVLLRTLFASKDPSRLRAFVDRLFEDETKDSRIKLLETFVTQWYTEEEASTRLSDPMLWVEIRRLSNMEVVEVIERCGGVPQYDMFF